MTIDTRLLIDALDATSRAVMITDADGTIVWVNRAFTGTTGWSAEDARGKTPRILSSGRHDADFYEAMWDSLRSQGCWEGEIWNRRRSGEIYPEALTIDAVHGADGQITHYVAVFSDDGEQRMREERLAHLAYHDELTGLPNRSLFLDRLDRAVSLARRRGVQLAVQILDLDGFKRVNDAFGHEAGDLMLKAVAERLKSCVRDSDTVARWGGDEFALVLPVLDNAAAAREASFRVLTALRRPFYIAGDEVSIRASIGIALFPEDGTGPTDLIRSADLAMYEVKRRNKGKFAFYGDIEMPDQARRRAG